MHTYIPFVYMYMYVCRHVDINHNSHNLHMYMNLSEETKMKQETCPQTGTINHHH